MASETTKSAPTLAAGRVVDEILLPVVAGSLHSRALPLAAAMAATWHLPIRLVHVTDSISSADEDLDAVIEGIRSWYPTIEVSARHVYGDDRARAIAQEVKPHTLPILASDHMDKWRFKDSVAEALVAEAGVPVMLIGPKVTREAVRNGALDGEIVVGLDMSAAAESAIEPAIGLARATGRGVWLVTVVPKPEPGGASAPSPGQYLQQIADRYVPELDVWWSVVQSNDPVTAIETFAHQHSARFIVASAGGRADPSHHSMASISSGLVNASARPVLVLKSAETPVLDVG